MTDAVRIAIVEPMASGGLIHYAYQLGEALSNLDAHITLVTAQEYELEELPHTIDVVRLFRLWARHDAFTSREARAGGMHRLMLAVYRQVRRVGRGWMLLREWFRLTKFLLQERPDIVQFGKINFLFEGFFLAWLKRRGLVLTDICHEFELREQEGSWFGWLAGRIIPLTFRPFSMVFFHAKANQRDFLSSGALPREKTCVIPMGNQQVFKPASIRPQDVESCRQRYGLQPDEQVVLFFGNLTYSKGLPELVSAFAALGRNRKARLLIAGYPTKFMDLTGLQQQVSGLQLEEQVIFDLRYIPMEEVPALMDLASFLVFPYRNSSQSGSLQMAYSFGKAVIATRVGGLPEVVEEGRSGLLVDPGSIEQLTRAMEDLIDHPEQAKAMGSYAMELSETKFSWQGIAGRILEQYKRILR